MKLMCSNLFMCMSKIRVLALMSCINVEVVCLLLFIMFLSEAHKKNIIDGEESFPPLEETRFVFCVWVV